MALPSVIFLDDSNKNTFPTNFISGMSIGSNSNEVIVTNSERGVACYALKSQKQLLYSWTDENLNSKFISSVIWDPFSSQYFGAMINSNSNFDLLSWTKDSNSNCMGLNLTNRKQIASSIHSILPLYGPTQPSLLKLDHCKVSKDELISLGGFLTVNLNGELTHYSKDLEKIEKNSSQSVSSRSAFVVSVATSTSKINFKSNQVKFEPLDSDSSEVSWILSIVVTERDGVRSRKVKENKDKSQSQSQAGLNHPNHDSLDKDMENKHDDNDNDNDYDNNNNINDDGEDNIQMEDENSNIIKSNVDKSRMKHYLKLYSITISKYNKINDNINNNINNNDKIFPIIRFIGSMEIPFLQNLKFKNFEFENLKSENFESLKILGHTFHDNGSVSVLWSNNYLQFFSIANQISKISKQLFLFLKEKNRPLFLSKAKVNFESHFSETKSGFSNFDTEENEKASKIKNSSKKRVLNTEKEVENEIKKKNEIETEKENENILTRKLKFLLLSLSKGEDIALICKLEKKGEGEREGEEGKKKEIAVNDKKQDTEIDSVRAVNQDQDGIEDDSNLNSNSNLDLILIDGKYGTIRSVTPLFIPEPKSTEVKRSADVDSDTCADSDFSVQSYCIACESQNGVLFVSFDSFVVKIMMKKEEVLLSDVIGSFHRNSNLNLDLNLNLNLNSNLDGWKGTNEHSLQYVDKVMDDVFINDESLVSSFHPWFRFSKYETGGKEGRRKGKEGRRREEKKEKEKEEENDNENEKEKKEVYCPINDDILDLQRIDYDDDFAKRRKEEAFEFLNFLKNSKKDHSILEMAEKILNFGKNYFSKPTFSKPDVSEPDVSKPHFSRRSFRAQYGKKDSNFVVFCQGERELTFEIKSLNANSDYEMIKNLKNILKYIPSPFLYLLFNICFKNEYYSFCKWMIELQSLSYLDFPHLMDMLMTAGKADLLECSFRHVADVAPPTLSRALIFCLFPPKRFSSSFEPIFLRRKSYLDFLINRIESKSDTRNRQIANRDIHDVEMDDVADKHPKGSDEFFPFDFFDQDETLENLLKMAVVADSAIQGFSASEICLHSLVASDCDHAVLAAVLADLNPRQIIRLMQYLTKWVDRYLHRIRSIDPTPPGVRLLLPVPSQEKVLTWLSTLIDVHFLKLMMRPDAMDDVLNLNRSISSILQSFKIQNSLYGVLKTFVSNFV